MNSIPHENSEGKISKFIVYDQHQELLLPKSVQDYVPKDHLARTVSDIIDHLDIGPLVETYDHRGAPAYHPRMMMKLIVYANLIGMRGSRRIEAALHDSLVFMYLSGRQTPDFHTICRFRREHGTRIEEVFDKVVGICAGLKMVGGRDVFCDGCHVCGILFLWLISAIYSKMQISHFLR